MKKYLLFILFIGLFGGVSFARAELSDSQIKSVVSLLESFGADGATISNTDSALRGGRTLPLPVPVPGRLESDVQRDIITPTPTPIATDRTDSMPSSSAPNMDKPHLACTNIELNLKMRARDGQAREITRLQDFLRERGHFARNSTGYFGEVTLDSVKKFQRENGISQTGFVGPLTRERIKSLTCGQ